MRTVPEGDVSPGGVVDYLSQHEADALRIRDVGERVVAYVDHIGRIEGVIMRTFNGGFAMSIVSTPRPASECPAPQ